MKRALTVGVLMTLGLVGAGMAVYSVVAVLGPVQDLAPPNGPLHCHGSALTLRDRSSILRKPDGLDCRSQARDQISGGAASLTVGLVLLGAGFAIAAGRKRAEDLQTAEVSGEWAVAPSMRRLAATPAVAFAADAGIGALVWPATSVVTAAAIAWASATLWLLLRRLRVTADATGLTVVRSVSGSRIAYSEFDGVVPTGRGLFMFRTDGRWITSGITHQTRLPHSQQTTRADLIASALAARLARARGGNAAEYIRVPEGARSELDRRRQMARKRAIAVLGVWLLLSLLGKIL